MTRQRRQRFVGSWRSGLIVSAILFGMFGVAVDCISAQDEDGAGLVLSGRVTAKDIGMPIYPGARPHKDMGADSGAARVGLWAGGSGFKLAALKLESHDAPAQVADFYQKALAKYGKVLNCASNEKKNDSSGLLTCGDDKPDKGGMLYKSGTKEKQHIVAIEPYGKGTKFTLLYIWDKSD
jgi:hypothetical protein